MPEFFAGWGVGAWWLFGSTEEAARRLGISERSLFNLMERKTLRDKDRHALDAAWQGFSSDQRFAIRYGSEFVSALSPAQADVLRGDNPDQEVFKGRKFIKAVRQFIRRRDKMPKGVGDFIEEVGSP